MSAAEESAAEVYRALLRSAMAALRGTDSELDTAFKRAAKIVRRRLRSINLTEREVEAVLVDAFASAIAEPRRKAIESAIRRSAQRGVEADSATFRAVFGRLLGSDPAPFLKGSRSQRGETRSGSHRSGSED